MTLDAYARFRERGYLKKTADTKVTFNPQPKAMKRKKGMADAKLWDAFSAFIRLRDADEQGVCRCFTCGRPTIWNKNTDCGHGIPRQHFCTKYSEINNHAQCKNCNGFEGGMREAYKVNVDKRYGVGTWDRLVIQSKQSCKKTRFEIDVMEKHYKGLAKQLRQDKGL